MRIKPFPILVIRLEGGPDDGQTRLMQAVTSVAPPEWLRSSSDAPGVYVRQPELIAPRVWTYRWAVANLPRQ
jgi:hypothetical protein